MTRLRPVPVYTTPGRIIATTVAAAAGSAGIFYAGFTVVSRATWRALNTNPKYGHNPRSIK